MTRSDYLTYKLKRANNALKVAETLLQEEFSEDAVNRIYYAVFYAVSAILYTKKLYPKTHLGTKALFSKEFIQSGLIDKEYSDFYGIIFAKRFEADYQDFAEIDINAVRSYLNEAEQFIKRITEYIEGQNEET